MDHLVVAYRLSSCGSQAPEHVGSAEAVHRLVNTDYSKIPQWDSMSYLSHQNAISLLHFSSSPYSNDKEASCEVPKITRGSQGTKWRENLQPMISSCETHRYKPLRRKALVAGTSLFTNFPKTLITCTTIFSGFPFPKEGPGNTRVSKCSSPPKRHVWEVVWSNEIKKHFVLHPTLAQKVPK